MNSTERLPVILTMSGTRVDASLINKQLINTTMAQRSWLGNHSNDVHTPHRFVGAEMFSWFCVLFSSVCSLLIFIKSCTVCVIILPVKTFNMARPLSHVSERRDFISILYSLSYIYTWHFSHYRISSLSLSLIQDVSGPGETGRLGLRYCAGLSGVWLLQSQRHKPTGAGQYLLWALEDHQ